MSKFCLSETIRERLYEAEQECEMHQKIVSLNAEHMDTWEYRDRKGFELGDIHHLAESIRSVGQSQPIIVVEQSTEFKPRHNKSVRYVVIAGYRRWLACKLYGMPIQAIIKRMDFDEALACLISENEKEDVSDFSKGMFYHQILLSQKLTQEALSKGLSLTPSALNHFLAFSQVPEELWEAVGDMSDVSSHTAAFIRSLINKGPEYLPVLKRLAPEIKRGAGAKSLQKQIEGLMAPRRAAAHETLFLVEFNKKPIFSVKNGRVNIDKKLLKHPKANELFEHLEQVILSFAHQYLDPGQKN